MKWLTWRQSPNLQLLLHYFVILAISSLSYGEIGSSGFPAVMHQSNQIIRNVADVTVQLLVQMRMNKKIHNRVLKLKCIESTFGSYLVHK